MEVNPTEKQIAEAVKIAGYAVASGSADQARGRFEAEGLSFCWEVRGGSEAVFWTCIGTIPENPPASLCESLLEANLLGARTGGGAIGLYPPTRAAVYSVTLRLEGLDETALAAMLRAFVSNVPGLVREFDLAQPAGAGESEPPSGSELFSAGMLWV